MLSKSKISLINSLDQKKYRARNNLFVVEGEKIIKEVLVSGVEIEYLFLTDNIDMENSSGLIKESFYISPNEMKKISRLSTPTKALGLIKIHEKKLDYDSLKLSLCLYFEELQNPGNLGTIIRICDWFGISDIILSENSVDIYSPKVIQASMGSFLRVNVFYKNPKDFISEYKSICKNKCYGTYINEKNIYTEKIDQAALLCFGNEGRGISADMEKLIDEKISIPSFSKNNARCESLNIASATAIFCSEFKRR